MKKIIVDILSKIIYLVDWIIPKGNNHIIFYSSPDFTDNCRAMYECLQSSIKKDEYHVTWVIKNVIKYREQFPQIRFVKHKSLFSLWYFCRARYIIRTHSFWNNIYIPKRQIMCVAWHGMLLKGYHYSEIGTYSRNAHDHFCVSSPLFAKLYSEMFNADIDRFDIVGFPRNDYLFQTKDDLLERMQLDQFKKIILWMPTFRSYGSNMQDGTSSESGVPTLKTSDFQELNDKLKELNYVLLLKLHPWALESVKDIGEYPMIRVIKNEDIPSEYNLYHLIGCADAMISDYSSVWGDYLLLDRPIGFAFDDLEQYKKSRYIPLSPLENYMPGPHICNCQDLLIFLESLTDKDSYIQKRKEIRDLFLSDQDGNSSERFLKAIGLL